MLPLTKEELESYQNAKLCCICGKRILKELSKRNYCHYTGKYRGAARSICNVKLNVSNEIAVVFRTGLIKELANEFERNF